MQHKEESDLEILALLAQQEDGLADLYATFAARFPAQRAFWQELSQQEVGHAALVRSLAQKVTEGVCYFDHGVLTLRALHQAIADTETTKQKALGPQFTAISALLAARAAENGILNHRLCAIRQHSDAFVEGILKRLTDETQKHRQAVQAAWEEARR